MSSKTTKDKHDYIYLTLFIHQLCSSNKDKMRDIFHLLIKSEECHITTNFKMQKQNQTQNISVKQFSSKMKPKILSSEYGVIDILIANNKNKSKHK